MLFSKSIGIPSSFNQKGKNIITVEMDIRDENGFSIDIDNVEKPEQDLVRYFINENDIVLELGARYGSVSCTINAILKNKTNQVSVEPDERVWSALERNKVINNCNFHIVKGFISSKKLALTELDSWDGYAATSVINDKSTIPSYTLNEIKEKYNLDFNVLVADCEGFLEQFLDENAYLYDELRLVIFEADYAEKCNYEKIRLILKEKGFVMILDGFQNCWIKSF